MSDDIRLGYLGFEVRDLAAWEAFAVDVLGLEVASGRTTGRSSSALRRPARSASS